MHMLAPVLAYVGLGSNLDGPAAQLRLALAEFTQLQDTRLVAASPLYKSAPLGLRNQPDYINAAAALATRLTPLVLLHALQAIEVRHGRRRDGPRWGPRTLDLDLLVYGQACMQTPELTLPHPGIPERSFVLYPLADIAPGLVIPGHGTVETLRERCDPHTIAALREMTHE